jgi:hypothetical protein
MKKLFCVLFVLLMAGTVYSADKKTSELDALTAPVSGDLFNIVDVSDTTMAASGTNKKITFDYVTAPPLTGGTSKTFDAPSGYYICTSTCSITPPSPVDNLAYQFCVMNDTNVNTVITLSAVSGVQYENSGRTALCTANHSMTSGGAVGDKICIVGYGTGKYLTAASQGTWTCQ